MTDRWMCARGWQCRECHAWVKGGEWHEHPPAGVTDEPWSRNVRNVTAALGTCSHAESPRPGVWCDDCHPLKT